MHLARIPLLMTALIMASPTLAACGPSAADSSGGQPDRPMSIVAAFYPLQFIAERVGGDAVTVSSLTKPGTEPHDLELAPRDIAHMSDADLAVYLSGFQPAVDAAITTAPPHAVFDVRSAANLSLTYTPLDAGSDSGDSVVDPHFWLDPLRLADVADALAQKMQTEDPADAVTFAANARKLRNQLTGLDRAFRSGLANCSNTDIVTTHSAFGYLANAFGLTQVGITGLNPENEPTPAQLASVAEFVTANHVHTIYFEPLVSPDIADTIARSTGARTQVLDPIEGLSSASRGDNYLAIMRSNLTALETGQPCS